MGNLLLNLRYMLPPILIVVAAGVLVGGIHALVRSCTYYS